MEMDEDHETLIDNEDIDADREEALIVEDGSKVTSLVRDVQSPADGCPIREMSNPLWTCREMSNPLWSQPQNYNQNVPWCNSRGYGTLRSTNV